MKRTMKSCRKKFKTSDADSGIRYLFNDDGTFNADSQNGTDPVQEYFRSAHERTENIWGLMVQSESDCFIYSFVIGIDVYTIRWNRNTGHTDEILINYKSITLKQYKELMSVLNIA